MAQELPRPKIWRYPELLSEHSFDKLRLLERSSAEFDAAIEDADIIDEQRAGRGA